MTRWSWRATRLFGHRWWKGTGVAAPRARGWRGDPILQHREARDSPEVADSRSKLGGGGNGGGEVLWWPGL
jgi:hypothetical protein